MSPTQIKPVSDRILLQPIVEEAKTQSGLTLIETTDERLQKPTLKGRVVAVGPGRISPSGALVPVLIPVGTEVIYFRSAVVPHEIDGVEYHFVREPEVIMAPEI